MPAGSTSHSSSSPRSCRSFPLDGLVCHSVRRAVATRWGRVDLVVLTFPLDPFHSGDHVTRRLRDRPAGWSSQQNMPCSADFARARQMVSYEISMGMSTIPVLLLAGTSASIRSSISSVGGWNVHHLTVAFFIFMVAGSPRPTACRSICRSGVGADRGTTPSTAR